MPSVAARADDNNTQPSTTTVSMCCSSRPIPCPMNAIVPFYCPVGGEDDMVQSVTDVVAAKTRPMHLSRYQQLRSAMGATKSSTRDTFVDKASKVADIGGSIGGVVYPHECQDFCENSPTNVDDQDILRFKRALLGFFSHFVEETCNAICVKPAGIPSLEPLFALQLVTRGRRDSASTLLVQLITCNKASGPHEHSQCFLRQDCDNGKVQAVAFEHAPIGDVFFSPKRTAFVQSKRKSAQTGANLDPKGKGSYLVYTHHELAYEVEWLILGGCRGLGMKYLRKLG